MDESSSKPIRNSKTHMSLYYFFKGRPPGQPLYQTHKSLIICNSYALNNITRLHRYDFHCYRIVQETSLSLAVDSSGQHVLLGGSYQGSNCFVNSYRINDSSNRCDQMIWGMSNNDLCRLQFIPEGNNIHAVTSNRGLKIIDTNELRVISQLNSSDHTSTHWSDWHPRDPNLLANCNEATLDLVDRRDRFMTATLTLAKYSEAECPNSYMKDGFASSCLWSPRNDNHLIVGNFDGSLVTYDRRNMARMDNGKVEGYYLSDLQMTPNGKYLFGWCRSNNTLYQWEYEDDRFKQHLDQYGVYWWNVANYPEFLSRNFQCYITDTHLYWPAKWAMKSHFDRVSAVVGSISGQNEHKLYTVGNSLGLQIWSVHAESEKGTPETIPTTRLEIGKRLKLSK